ncbi:MAG: FAD-binding protein [Thermomicrobiales bacterium]|nr:FAD-binding protein [Thermomicrobiales bacterium]
MDRAVLIERLERICGPGGVFHQPSDLLVYEYDGSVEGAVETAAPLAAALPTSTEQVAAIVALANEAGVPVTPRGAGTGLSGGAVAQGGGIIVALTRMDRILEVDRYDRTALVEPGVINLELSQYAMPQGLFFAPDPSSQTACTIGGNVAENSGGPHCLKYGVTTNHILGLEVVLPDGRVVWTGGRALGAPGYDLTGALVGSEGMLGIVTKALVRLSPTPDATLVQLAAFPDIDTASHATSRIIAAGIIPAALEMIDNLTIQAVEPQYHAGYPMDAGAVLLIEIDGPVEDVMATGEEIATICRECDATEVRSATDPAERALLWKGRKMALAAMGRLAPNYYLHDAVVPRSQLPATLARVGDISAEFGLPIANVFHAGDGNLHPLMLFDRRKPGDVEKVLGASKEIIQFCVAVGGTLSGEHGIGTEKREYMTLVYTGEDLAAMAGLKNAFDPGGRLNPGKVFPKGYMCGEVRALRAQAMAQKYGIYPV